ncbi:MAG: Flp pilus assembly complex ATPase component TadA, partial [Planctomycetes bacterium]|nr:Flp pilus assembly complex ATPase component TadA [Planctomycetota bacterium]
MEELPNVYHLHVEVAGQAPLFRAWLRREGTTEEWHGSDDEVFEVSKELLDRCADLQKHPECCIGTATTANPGHVDTEPTACTPFDIGAWLWTKLPQSVRTELQSYFGSTQPLRLILHPAPEVSILPWETLQAWAPIEPGSEREGAHAPFLTERAEILRFVDGGSEESAPPDLQPRVLLIVGSQKQRPEQTAAEHRALDVADSIRNHGFTCDIATGRNELRGIDRTAEPDVRLRGTDHVLKVIRDGHEGRGGYDIVHWIGHSNAHRRRSQSPLGATALLLEIEIEVEVDGQLRSKLEEKELAAEELADALRDSPTRLVVLHACMSRENLTDLLLGKADHGWAGDGRTGRDGDRPADEERARDGHPGAVDAVVGMAAMADPSACAAFAEHFYATLGHTGSLTEAVRVGRAAVRRSFAHLAWLPQHWTRTLHAFRIASAESQVIERYCRWLLETHRAFEGIFEDLHGALDSVAVTLDVARDGDPTGGPAARNQRVLADLPPGRMRFADLLRGGWKWWTLGGEPGSGKTTTLNILSSFIPGDERIVTIEDAAELQLRQEHVVSLETRPANIEGEGEISMRELVKNCLRMRPERIIVG